MRQEKFSTGMYIVDQGYRIVNKNDAMDEMYPGIQIGDICYKALALRDTPCESCPLVTDNALFYNPIRKEWIYANAAAMDHPGLGECYHVQFQLRQRIADVGQETPQDENMDEQILELSGGDPNACAIGGYCEPGSPLAYANAPLLKLMGYDSLEELHQDVDGLVFNTIHPDDVDRVTADLTRCAQHGGHFESNYRLRRKGQSWFWVVSRGARVETKTGDFMLLAVVEEMQEFVKGQGSLRQENKTLLQQQLTSKAMLEHMPGGYHQCANTDGWPFLYFGASFEEITGWTRQEIQEDFGNLFVNLVYPEDVPLCAEIVSDVREKGYSNTMYRLKKKGGGYTWVSDSTTRVDLGSTSFYQGVLADITRQVEEMEHAKLEAEASNRAKSTFLFNASHDFRTPMNAIRGYAHFIEENAENPQRVLDSIRKLKQSSDILLTLMDDVLELSRIERGKEIISNRPLDMLEHANKLHELMRADMEQSGITFRMENDIQHPYVLADDLKLSRMAMNLLSNAKKFTPAGGTVTFGIRETGYHGETATYSLFVQDTGIGMSQEFQKRAFEQFERERTSTDSGISGSGLGLAIIKKISDLLGGQCIIESELGKGSRITCSVPLTIVSQIETQREERLPDWDCSGRRILMVEDNDFNREVGRYVFEGVGFAVDEAENGVACLEKLTQAPAGYYDLILMDVQMPIMDGYTATREIRQLADPALAKIPIVAMTANAFEEDKQRCLDVGMDGHISKPLDAKAVLKEFMRVMPE